MLQKHIYEAQQTQIVVYSYENQEVLPKMQQAASTTSKISYTSLQW